MGYTTAEGFEVPVKVVLVFLVEAMFEGVEFEVWETKQLGC